MYGWSNKLIHIVNQMVTIIRSQKRVLRVRNFGTVISAMITDEVTVVTASNRSLYHIYSLLLSLRFSTVARAMTTDQLKLLNALFAHKHAPAITLVNLYLLTNILKG